MAVRKLGKTDIRFDDPRLAQLMRHVNRITEELALIQGLLDEGTEGQILVKHSARDFHGGWADPGSGGGGGATTAQNVGNGAGVFRDKSGTTLNLRSITGSSGISIDVVGDEIRITSTQSLDELEPLMIAGVF